MTKPIRPHDAAPKQGTDLETPTRESPTSDEERIDESIDESFPASDPPAVHPAEKK